MKNQQIYQFVLSIAIIIFDQISKMIALAACANGPMRVNRFLIFEIMCNRGVSWSMLHSENGYVFSLLTLAIITITIFLGVYAYRRWQNNKMVWGEVMVIAGSLSNIIDRFWHHGVIDFIEISFYQFTWPVFNVADVAIVLGVGIMFWESYKQ
jgi:signal peptidase II